MLKTRDTKGTGKLNAPPSSVLNNLMAGETYLNFIAFIYIFIITYRWWESHIMEWNLPLWLPAANKQMQLFNMFFGLMETMTMLPSTFG